MAQPNPRPGNPGKATSIIHRLSPEAYRQLEQQVQAPFVTDKTTDTQAGFQLGIQYILKLLRDGFVIGA